MLLRALVKCRPLTSDESLSIDQLAYKLIIDGDYARFCAGLPGRYAAAGSQRTRRHGGIGVWVLAAAVAAIAFIVFNSSRRNHSQLLTRNVDGSFDKQQRANAAPSHADPANDRRQQIVDDFNTIYKLTSIGELSDEAFHDAEAGALDRSALRHDGNSSWSYS
jgi:hypothetical protein